MCRLTGQEFLRLEALRLAVQAGFPELRQQFLDFLTDRHVELSCTGEHAVQENADVS